MLKNRKFFFLKLLLVEAISHCSSLKGVKCFVDIFLGERNAKNSEESVSSLKMGDEHLNTQKDSRESSVKYPIPTPRELDVIPDEYYDENYQKRFDELVKDFLSPTSIYDNISIGYLGTIESKEIDTPITPDIPLREETPRYFYDGSMDNGEDIIPLMRISKETGLPEKIIDKSLSESFVSRMNVCQPIPIPRFCPILETVNSLKMGEVHFDTSINFQNELNNEKNSNSETIADVPIKDSLLMEDLKFFDDLLNEDPLFPDVFNVENDFQDYKEEIDISCDMIPPGIDIDDDSEGDVPP
ncbi:hypothetical protein Tco_0592575 [Tanacetum coccineum]